jgi:hypothetical protein
VRRVARVRFQRLATADQGGGCQDGEDEGVAVRHQKGKIEVLLCFGSLLSNLKNVR